MTSGKLGNSSLRPISLVLLFVALGCGSGRQSDSQFAAGRQALARGDNATAIKQLSGYLERKPQGGLASRASFLIAKAQLGLGDLEAARSQFEKTAREHPDSEEAHKSQYKLAMISFMQGKRDDASQRFKSLVVTPNGTLVPEATAMLLFLEKQAEAAAKTGTE